MERDEVYLIHQPSLRRKIPRTGWRRENPVRSKRQTCPFVKPNASSIVKYIRSDSIHGREPVDRVTLHARKTGINNVLAMLWARTWRGLVTSREGIAGRYVLPR